MEIWAQTGNVPRDAKECMRYVLECRMPWTAERRVEGLRSRVHVQLGRCHCHTEAYASLVLRSPGLRQQIKDDPLFLKALIQHAGHVRTTYKCASRLGFKHHAILRQVKGHLQGRKLSRQSSTNTISICSEFRTLPCELCSLS